MEPEGPTSIPSTGSSTWLLFYSIRLVGHPDKGSGLSGWAQSLPGGNSRARTCQEDMAHSWGASIGAFFPPMPSASCCLGPHGRKPCHAEKLLSSRNSPVTITRCPQAVLGACPGNACTFSAWEVVCDSDIRHFPLFFNIPFSGKPFPEWGSVLHVHLRNGSLPRNGQLWMQVKGLITKPGYSNSITRTYMVGENQIRSNCPLTYMHTCTCAHTHIHVCIHM